jgi:hypothetical protein
MRTITGVGKTKITLIARDLIRLDPLLHSKLAPQFGVSAPSSTAATIATTHPRRCDAQVGEWASHLSDVDRDILERRLCWKSRRTPASLAVIAADHGVTRARIQQRQRSLARVLSRLPALRRLRERLLMIAGDRQRSAARARSLGEYHEEIDYVLNNLDFLSRLYASESGQRPFRDSRKPCAIVVISARDE